MTDREAKELSIATLQTNATLQANRLAREYGRTILGEIAYSIRDECRCPFEADGSLSEEGLKAAGHIVLELISACGKEFFYDITRDILSTFREFHDHEPQYDGE